jgi:hypothetical protein
VVSICGHIENLREKSIGHKKPGLGGRGLGEGGKKEKPGLNGLGFFVSKKENPPLPLRHQVGKSLSQGK